MSDETWLVLGGSSAIARAFAREAGAHGCDVLLAGRDHEDLTRTAADVALRSGRRAEAVAFDALDYESHAGFVASCLERCGGNLNVLLAFGTMPSQDEIARDFTLAQATVAANYLGAVSVLTHLAPAMEARRGGRLVVLGSVAGDRGRLKNYTYGSAKAGLHAYVQGLRARLWRAGVAVTTVKLGVVDTAMTWGLNSPLPAASPGTTARRIWRAAKAARPVVYVPWFWRPVMTVIGLLPERVAMRLTF